MKKVNNNFVIFIKSITKLIRPINLQMIVGYIKGECSSTLDLNKEKILLIIYDLYVLRTSENMFLGPQRLIKK